MTVDRIRQVSASDPSMALELVRVVVDAERAARNLGRHELADAPRRQVELVMDQSTRGATLDSDVDRMLRAGRGRPHDDHVGSRQSEYPADEQAG